MDSRFNSFSPRASLAALVLASGLVVFAAPAAKAQFFSFNFGSPPGLRPGQVERMIEAHGLQLTGPVNRNGGVYIVDAAGPDQTPQRFIIDAYDGRVLQRFRGATPRYYDETSPPRPPADIGMVSVQPHRHSSIVPDDDEVDVEPLRHAPAAANNGSVSVEPLRHAPATTTGAPPAVITFHDTVARTDDAASPNVISVPHTIGEGADGASKAAKAKAVQQQPVKHKTVELTPLAQPANPPASAKSPPAASSEAPARVVADTKVVVAPAPAAAVPAPVVAPKASAAKPAINDVPVDPLE